MTTSARVCDVINDSRCSRSGSQPLPGSVRSVRRDRANLRQDRGVQRIRRRRHEHRLAGVHECRQRQLDPLRRARGDQHPIGIRRKAMAGPVLRDRLTRLGNTGRGDVPVTAVAQGPLQRLDGGRWRARIRTGRDRQCSGSGLFAGGLYLSGLRHDIPNRIAESVNTVGHGNRGLDGHGGDISRAKRPLRPKRPPTCRSGRCTTTMHMPARSDGGQRKIYTADDSRVSFTRITVGQD